MIWPTAGWRYDSECGRLAPGVLGASLHGQVDSDRRGSSTSWPMVWLFC